MPEAAAIDGAERHDHLRSAPVVSRRTVLASERESGDVAPRIWAEAAGAALVGVVLATIASEAGCGSTDGSFRIDDPFADPSGYCEATNFPGFPDTIGSSLLVAGIYLSPALVLTVTAMLNRRTGNPAVVRFGRLAAIALIVVATALTLGAANVDYAGSV